MLGFVIAAALLTLSPGPDTLLVLRNTVRGGRGDGLRTTLGITSGLVVHATLSALGLSLILVRSATAFELVKLVGAGYLVWLGVQSLRRQGSVAMVATAGPARPFREGFLTNVLNPKVAVFYLAFLPQFAAPPFVLAAIHMAMGLVWLSIVAAAVVVTSPVVQRWMDRLCGVVLVGFGVAMVRKAA
jgi:threonine/homoserine/homoserine lactone efflux protein